MWDRLDLEITAAEREANPKGKPKSQIATFSDELPKSDGILDDIRKYPKSQQFKQKLGKKVRLDNYQPEGVDYGQNISESNVGANHDTPKHGRRPRTMHASNWGNMHSIMEETEEQLGMVIYSNNSEVLVGLYDYNQLIWNYICSPLALVSYNYPSSRNLQQENGVLITIERSRRYDINALVWEAIMSVPDRSILLTHLRGKQWILPGHMDMFNTSNNQKVARAPLGYNCFVYLAMIRLLFKTIDDAPPSLEAKLTCAINALHVLEWYFSKLAMGKNERVVKRYFFEAVQDDGDVISLIRRLRYLDTQHTSFGRKSFDDYRDDVIVSGHLSTDGCVAPKVLENLRKSKEKMNNSNSRFPTPRRAPKIRPGTRTGSLRSAFSAAKGKAPAPTLKQFYDEKKHKTPKDDGTFPSELCRKWQTDSCILPGTQRCPRFHLCQWCGLPHPGSRCRHNNN